MFRKISIKCAVLFLIITAAHAENISPLHFNIPAYASVTINNSESKQVHYQCQISSFGADQLTFQSIKGTNQVNALVLKEGYQVSLAIDNEQQTLLTIDSLGKLRLKNGADDSIELDCIV